MSRKLNVSQRLGNWMDRRSSIGGSIVILLALILTGTVILATYNVVCREGYDITVTGTVNVIRLDHNKPFNFDFTYIELLTFSGDEYDIDFFGHVPLEFGSSYTITYRLRSPLGHHVVLYGDISSITPLNITKAWSWYPP